MTRTMYDALEASGIPAGAQLGCWYPYDSRSDGPPRGARQILTIDNSFGGAHPDCHIADAESGAMEWADVPGWVNRCTQPQPTVYCSLSNTGTLFAQMASVTRPWYLWVAQYLSPPRAVVPAVPGRPGNCTLIGGQYEDAGPYDLSVIIDDSWYPAGGDDMASVAVQNGWRWCTKCQGLVYSPEPSASAGACPAGGAHNCSESNDYALPYAGA